MMPGAKRAVRILVKSTVKSKLPFCSNAACPTKKPCRCPSKVAGYVTQRFLRYGVALNFPKLRSRASDGTSWLCTLSQHPENECWETARYDDSPTGNTETRFGKYMSLNPIRYSPVPSSTNPVNMVVMRSNCHFVCMDRVFPQKIVDALRGSWASASPGRLVGSPHELPIQVSSMREAVPMAGGAPLSCMDDLDWSPCFDFEGDCTSVPNRVDVQELGPPADFGEPNCEDETLSSEFIIFAWTLAHGGDVITMFVVVFRRCQRRHRCFRSNETWRLSARSCGVGMRKHC